MEIKVRAWDNHEKRWAKTHEIEGELFINPEADDTEILSWEYIEAEKHSEQQG